MLIQASRGFDPFGGLPLEMIERIYRGYSEAIWEM